MENPPLILTLRLDHDSQSFFNSARRKYFPAGRNHLDAHLTLFHQLPDEPETMQYLDSFQHEAFEVKVEGLINLGAGAAYSVKSEALDQLHEQLRKHFRERLIPQDRQPFRPHITIMNKATPAAAKELLEELRQTLQPFTATATGLSIWRYLGGPWDHILDFAFPATQV